MKWKNVANLFITGNIANTYYRPQICILARIYQIRKHGMMEVIFVFWDLHCGPLNYAVISNLVLCFIFYNTVINLFRSVFICCRLWGVILIVPVWQLHDGDKVIGLFGHELNGSARSFHLEGYSPEGLGDGSPQWVPPVAGLGKLKQFADVVYRLWLRDQNLKSKHNSADSWPVCFTVGGD